MARHAKTKFVLVERALRGALREIATNRCQPRITPMPPRSRGLRHCCPAVSFQRSELHRVPHRSALHQADLRNLPQHAELEGASQLRSHVHEVCARRRTSKRDRLHRLSQTRRHCAAYCAARVKVSADFSHTPKQCFECHDDIHGGQFMTPGKRARIAPVATQLQNGAPLRSITIRPDYPLDGAHSMVRCAQCHTQQKEIDGRVVRMYRGTPKNCEGCHAANSPELNGKKSAP